VRSLKTLLALVLLLGCLAVPKPASARTERSGPLYYVTQTATVRAGASAAPLEATCPSGSSAVGGGGGFDIRRPGARVSKLIPEAHPWTTALGWNGDARDRTFTSVAVCLREPLNATLIYYSFFNGPTGTAVTTIDTSGMPCPGTMVGGGGGEEADAGRMLVETYPLTPTTWAVKSVGAMTIHTLQVVEACLDAGVLESQFAFAQRDVKANAIGTAKATCPRGTRVSAGGVRSPSTIIASRPFDSRKDRDRVPDDGWLGVVQNGVTDNVFDVHAVCVRPA
jgi:hypothetical protein